MSLLISKNSSEKTKSLLIKKADEDKDKPTRYFSDMQEKDVAKAVKGKQTANSGATIFGGKSDVAIANLFSLECKTKMTHSESISLKREWFEKLQQEAIFDGHPYSALIFNFGPGEPNHYVIDEFLFQDLINYLTNYKNEE